METPNIPFMGDSDVNNKTMPENLSPWIDPNDKVPLLLALSLYGEIRKELFSFKLFRNDVRCAAWIGPSNIVIIGCRGTSIGSKYGTRDLQDDSIIALNSDYCDLTLVTLISKLVQDVYKKINNVPSGVDKVFDFVLGRKRDVGNYSQRNCTWQTHEESVQTRRNKRYDIYS